MFLCIFPVAVFSQATGTNETKPLQFSGLVLTADSNYPVPYATVKIKHTSRGAIANVQGFFTLVTLPGEEVEFSSIGYKKRIVTIPSEVADQKYTMLVSLQPDTLELEEALIYPLPSKEKFKQAFVSTDVSLDKTDIVRENLSPEKMMIIQLNMSMDGHENQSYYLSQLVESARYYGGQSNYAQFPGMSYPVPLSLLNPFAWAEFIKDLKAGKLKDKYKEYRQ